MHHKHNYNICCQCEKPGINLVSPCGNERCIVRIHPTCLENQIESNNEVCVKCSRPIIHNTVKKVNLSNFICSLFVVVTYIIGLLLPILLVMGTDIIFFRIHSDNNKESNSLVLINSFSFLTLVMLYLAYFMIIADEKCYNCLEKIFLKYYIHSFPKNIFTYVSCMAVYIFNIVITIGQLFGSIILKNMYGNYYFNFWSFFTGLISSIICGLVIMIIYGIILYCKKLYQQNLEEKTMYGVVIDI